MQGRQVVLDLLYFGRDRRLAGPGAVAVPLQLAPQLARRSPLGCQQRVERLVRAGQVGGRLNMGGWRAASRACSWPMWLSGVGCGPFIVPP